MPAGTQCRCLATASKMLREQGLVLLDAFVQLATLGAGSEHLAQASLPVESGNDARFMSLHSPQSVAVVQWSRSKYQIAASSSESRYSRATPSSAGVAVRRGAS